MLDFLLKKMIELKMEKNIEPNTNFSYSLHDSYRDRGSYFLLYENNN